MDPQQQKGKAKAGPSAPVRKKSRPSKIQLARLTHAPPLQHGKMIKFRFKAVWKVGKQGYSKHTEAQYILKVFINRTSLLRDCLSMVR